MGITRDKFHKRRATGGRQKTWRKKRQFCIGRQSANTKLSPNTCVRRVRVRGGNYKFRALRLDNGNFSWGSEAVSRKTRILDVLYNASNNELVSTKTLVKNAIIQVDATPFKQWYQQHYGVELGQKKERAEAEFVNKGDEIATKDKLTEEKVGQSQRVLRKLEQRKSTRVMDAVFQDQFITGRILACISARPGQCGRADGYILEGKELDFYLRKIQRKKGSKAK